MKRKQKKKGEFSLRRRIRKYVKTSFAFIKLQSEKGKLFFGSVMNRTIKLTALIPARKK